MLTKIKNVSGIAAYENVDIPNISHFTGLSISSTDDMIINERIVDLIQSRDLQSVAYEYIHIFDIINKINSKWIKSSLVINDPVLKEELYSNLEAYEFFNDFNNYLTGISEDFGTNINQIELEKANYEYDARNEIVVVIKAPKNISSKKLNQLWDHMSQKALDFISSNKNYNKEEMCNKLILVVRRSHE